MIVHVVDGTYELFRHYFAVPSHRIPDGREVGALRGVLRSVIDLLDAGATHVGVATDHVIESFRNDLWPGYKTGAGIDPLLFGQFVPLEAALGLLGVRVWAMVDLEADDAMASAAAVADADPRVERVLLCTPDKDLAQCVRENRVVQFDRRQKRIDGHAGVVARFGVEPLSIPDYLALVGDSADGFPGLPGWGAKSASLVLARYRKLEDIPNVLDLPLRAPGKLVQTLRDRWDDALLFRDLATLRTTADVGGVDDWRWDGPRPGFDELCRELGAPELLDRTLALHGRASP